MSELYPLLRKLSEWEARWPGRFVSIRLNDGAWDVSMFVDEHHDAKPSSGDGWVAGPERETLSEAIEAAFETFGQESR